MQYLLRTLGVSALIPAWYQRYDAGARPGALLRVAHVFGLVPFAFYVIRVFTIRLLALLVAAAFGEPTDWLGWGGTFPAESPPDYGYGLPAVYLATFAVFAMLCFSCRWFAQLKARKRAWWLQLA